MDTPEIKVFRSVAQPRHGVHRHHCHSAVEISLIVAGRGSYRVGERDIPIEEGDIFLYPANQPHCMTEIDDEQPMCFLNVQFEPRCFWGFSQGESAAGLLQTLFLRNIRGDNRLQAGSDLNLSLRELMEESLAEQEEKKPGYADMIRSKVTCMLVLLSREEREIPEATVESDVTGRMNRSMDYICRHISEKLTLDCIASQANMSRTYYCTVFKNLNGISTWDYVNVKRVEKAMSLLKKTDGNVLDVALSCGFNNTANFNKIFKKVTGVTPKEYRRG